MAVSLPSVNKNITQPSNISIHVRNVRVKLQVTLTSPERSISAANECDSSRSTSAKRDALISRRLTSIASITRPSSNEKSLGTSCGAAPVAADLALSCCRSRSFSFWSSRFLHVAAFSLVLRADISVESPSCLLEGVLGEAISSLSLCAGAGVGCLGSSVGLGVGRVGGADSEAVDGFIGALEGLAWGGEGLGRPPGRLPG